MYAWSEVLDGFWMGEQNPAARKLLKDWSHPPGSNRRPADYESAALPTELGWPAEKSLGTERSPGISFLQQNIIRR